MERENEGLNLLVPQKGDFLVGTNQENWKLNAVLRPLDDYAYCLGYRQAGNILIEAAQRGEGYVDTLVYPICHAYRHFVELMLKRLIVIGCRVLQRGLTDSEEKLCNRSHDLSHLWEAFRGVEHQVYEAFQELPPPKEDMESIKDYIDQLHTIDGGSFSFRYATTTTGAASLNVPYLNIGQFGSYMERLANYLEGFDAYYKERLNLISSFYAEFGSEMQEDGNDC